MSAKVVIGVCGFARTGKDTVASILVERHGFVRRGFADALREQLLVLDPFVSPYRRLSDLITDRGWDAAKEDVPEVRRLMQVYGTDVRRAEHADVWIETLQRWVASTDATRIVVPDVRFPNEVGSVSALVRVTRPGVGPVNEHVSDNLVNDLRADYTISNDGTIEDLVRAVDALAGTLVG